MTISEYKADLDASISERYMLHPFYYHINNDIWHARQVSVVRFIPYLRGHVSITPHEQVTTHEHYYSFSRTGADIAWHSSGKKVPGVSRLSDFLFQVMYGLQKELFKPVPLEALYEMVSKDQHDNSDVKHNEENYMIKTIQDYGRILKKEYAISQFLLLRRNHVPDESTL